MNLGPYTGQLTNIYSRNLTATSGSFYLCSKIKYNILMLPILINSFFLNILVLLAVTTKLGKLFHWSYELICHYPYETDNENGDGYPSHIHSLFEVCAISGMTKYHKGPTKDPQRTAKEHYTGPQRIGNHDRTARLATIVFNF